LAHSKSRHLRSLGRIQPSKTSDPASDQKQWGLDGRLRNRPQDQQSLRGKRDPDSIQMALFWEQE